MEDAGNGIEISADSSPPPSWSRLGTMWCRCRCRCTTFLSFRSFRAIGAMWWMDGWMGDFYLGLDLTRYITTFLYTHIHVFIYSHIHIYTYTPLGTWWLRESRYAGWCVYIYICMYVYTCVYIYIHTHTHTHTHTLFVSTRLKPQTCACARY